MNKNQIIAQDLLSTPMLHNIITLEDQIEQQAHLKGVLTQQREQLIILFEILTFSTHRVRTIMNPKKLMFNSKTVPIF
jgi:hypothetical protein